jgi:tRNA G18 (ribose-2'-O)-methylase SpoU
MNTVRGFFEIGIYHGKTEHNIGTLWRSAYQLGAAGIFTIGRRYDKQASDTYKAYRHIPLRNYADFDAFNAARPFDCPLVGIEMGGQSIGPWPHPQRAIYLLGAEDHGLPPDILARCQHVVSLPSVREASFNVAVAGSIVMYDRLLERGGQ